MQRAALFLFTGLVLGATGAFFSAGRTRAPAYTDEAGALPVDSGTAATRRGADTRPSPGSGTPSRRVLAALAERPGATAERAALYDAASRHQVLLFTCHAEAWQDMGVEVREVPAA